MDAHVIRAPWKIQEAHHQRRVKVTRQGQRAPDARSACSRLTIFVPPTRTLWYLVFPFRPRGRASLVVSVTSSVSDRSSARRLACLRVSPLRLLRRTRVSSPINTARVSLSWNERHTVTFISLYD